MEQTCGRCGEVFEELVDGGCPGCGRKVAAGKPGKAPARRPERTYSQEGGERTWRLAAMVVVAVVGIGGGIVYKKITAAPPPPAVEAPRKKVTLKDWQAAVPPAKFIPALDALRVQAAKADQAPLEDVVEDVRRVLTGSEQLHAQILLLSALDGTSGKRAAPLLSVLALRLPMPVIVEIDDLRSLRTLTAKAALGYVDDKDDDARQGAAACLMFLADKHVKADGTSFRALPDESLAAIREACQRLAKDKRPETREAAAKALEFLSK